jgi:deoxycytidylate deaminase
VIKPPDPRSLCEDLLKRSSCSVRVAAVLVDGRGAYVSWGWNSVGSGFGKHAEVHCLERANKSRAEFAVLYVASERARNSKTINSKPCPSCQKFIKSFGVRSVWWRDVGDVWKVEHYL